MDEGTAERLPVEDELAALGVAYTLAAPVEGATSLEEFARRSGLLPRQVLKTLLLDIDAQRHALVLICGDRSADFAALRRYFAARSVRLADRDAVERVTGYRIGTVTPLAVKTRGLPVLLDEAALDEACVSLGTGRPGRHLRLAPADLALAIGAVSGAFARDASH